VPTTPGAPPELGELRDHVRRVLPASAAPRELVLVAELPMLASGKPDLRALRGSPPAAQVPGQHRDL